MAYDALHTVTTVGATGCHGLWQLGNLVLILADVTGNVPREAVVQLVTIAQRELPTDVLHFTGVDPLSGALTHGGNTVHRQQNVGGQLVEPVEATIDFVAQQCEVKTSVMLGSRLPLDVVVGTL